MLEVRRVGSPGSEIAFDRRLPRSHWSVLIACPRRGHNRRPHPRSTVVTDVWTPECMTVPPQRTIGGSGDAGAGEAPAQRVKLATEVSIAADEVSHRQQHDLEFVGAVVPPQPEPEVNSNSGNNCDSDGKPVSHLYTHLYTQCYPYRVSD